MRERGLSDGRAGLPNSAPRGWYADPVDPTRFRFWNGREWTEFLRDSMPKPVAPSKGDRFRYKYWTSQSRSSKIALLTLAVCCVGLCCLMVRMRMNAIAYQERWDPANWVYPGDCAVDSNMREYDKALGLPCRDFNNDGVLEYP